MFRKSVEEYDSLRKKAEQLKQEINDCERMRNEEEKHYIELKQEQKICRAEKESLSDSDTLKLKQQEVEIRRQLEELKKNITGKQQQEEEKKEKYQETEQRIKLQLQKNEILWEEIENSLEYMEEEIEGIPFDEFIFMKKELVEQKGEAYSFQSHSELLKDYMAKVHLGKTTLEEEKDCQEKYSRFLQELDIYQEEKNRAEREVLQYENQFHEVKQETIESIYRWEKENVELHLQSDILQEMAREISYINSNWLEGSGRRGANRVCRKNWDMD